jgi:hypothetical protein
MGVNFQPFEELGGVMYSDPILMEPMNADGSGNVSFTWLVPPTVDLGSHRVVVTGLMSGTVETSFVIQGAGTGGPGGTGGQGGSGGQGGTGGQGSGGGQSGTGGLPFTGASAPLAIGAAGLVLLLLGSLLMVAVRRRGRES